MNELTLTNDQKIQDKIYTIRDVQVMLDRDLAELYDVKPIRLREQVKRNKDKFPNDFMFELTNSEVEFMVSQNAIPSKQHLGGALPLVFTEQGVSMLATVLKSKTATEVSIKIMRTFVNMRKFFISNASIFQRLDTLEIKQLQNKLESDENVSMKIYTKSISKQLKLDLERHNAQYFKIEIGKFDLSHDRFLIIDESEVYHFGASLKDLGKKWFAVSRMDINSFEMIEKLN